MSRTVIVGLRNPYVSSKFISTAFRNYIATHAERRHYHSMLERESEEKYIFTELVTHLRLLITSPCSENRCNV